MGDITDGQVDDLLRQAEKRLANGSGGYSAVNSAVNSAVTPKSQDKGTPQQPTPEEKLSVRQPQKSKAPAKDSAGVNWFNLPPTDMTPEFKRDWQMLRMRNILDPKQQRKTLKANPPAYSQRGEIIAGPTDFYGARLTRKERKRTLLEEALGERDEAKLRTKYAGIQRNKTSGKRAFYQKVVSQRRKNKT